MSTCGINVVHITKDLQNVGFAQKQLGLAETMVGHQRVSCVTAR